MYRVAVSTRNELAPWRDCVRPLLAARVSPEDIMWVEGGEDADGLLDKAFTPPDRVMQVHGSRRFMALAAIALCHSDPGRLDLLYRIAFRLQAQRALLAVQTDPDIVQLTRLVKAVERDSHKMTAFVRFRALDESNERFAAWFEPDHYTLERTAPFFAERFANMEWAILTPYRSAFWTRERLVFGEGARKGDVPAEDALEDAWRTYFASIFNPARLKVSAMRAEMPQKYWRNLPEAEIIDDLIRSAQRRETAMIKAPASAPPVRHQRRAEGERRADTKAPQAFSSLEMARTAAAECTRCPLYENATQVVFGEGPSPAPLMMVGEQPGDHEDIEGRPFVGPAGRLLDEVLDDVRIDRKKVFVTNAVKHFKFVPRGKRRLHQKPNGGEVVACRFWLDHERALVKPKVIVALGATAAQSLLGARATIGELRGAPIAMADGTTVFVTVHPAFLLRVPDREKAAEERIAFARDLAAIRDHMEAIKGASVTLDSPRTGP